MRLTNKNNKTKIFKINSNVLLTNSSFSINFSNKELIKNMVQTISFYNQQREDYKFRKIIF